MLSSVATLRQYLGTYGTSGPSKFDIVLRADSSLAIKNAGGGFQDLVPVRPNEFRMKEFPDVVFQFSIVDGQATALKASDPAGELTFLRK
jgi:hypothetical protein